METSPDVRRERDRENVEKLFRVFDGLQVPNHQGKLITLELSRPRCEYDDSDTPAENQYLLQFKGYNGFNRNFLPRRGMDCNFAWFSVDYDFHLITPEYANLHNNELKSDQAGQGIFPAIRRLVGQAFPPDFTYRTVVDNQRTLQEYAAIKELVRSGHLSLIDAQAALKKHYKIRERVSAGFNVNYVYYGKGRHYGVEIYSLKNGAGREEFNVDFNFPKHK